MLCQSTAEAAVVSPGSRTLSRDFFRFPALLRALSLAVSLSARSRNFLGWASQLAASLERPRRFLILDLRNHGESPHVARMSYADMAADVVRVMQHQGITNAAVIGHR